MRHATLLWIPIATALVFIGSAFAQPGNSTSPPADGTAAAQATAAPPTSATPRPTTAPAATTAPTPTAAVTAPGTSPSQPIDGSTYVVRLRDLEQRIDELKEQIRRSHTRLSLLSDTILSGGVGGARAEIRFVNEMSGVFRLTRALFVLDGAVQFNKRDDSGSLASQREIPIFSGAVPPGDHTLQVLIELRGDGFGVLSYFKGYRFELKSSHNFTVTAGKTIDIRVVGWEKGDATTPFEQRPAIRYVEKVRRSTNRRGP